MSTDRGGWNPEGPIEAPLRQFEVPEPAKASGSGVSIEDESAALEAVMRDLDGVEEALRRLDAGAYGACEVCGEAIPATELEGEPLLTRCVAHR